MTGSQCRRTTTNSQQGRLSEVFWQLADQSQLERRDPESVVQAWLGAVDGLEGRRRDVATTQIALAFLMRLESDPFYASPEQTRGGDKDARGLVYSLALFLFERLTGHHPFVESLSPLECRIQQAKAKRVGTNNLCHLPRHLRALLSRALSPFAEDRFVDVGEMRSEVEAWLRGEQPVPKLLEHLRTSPRPVAAARPRGQGTVPPPTPKPRRAFADVDTLQGAVAVTTQSSPKAPLVTRAGSSPSPSPSPWLWQTISGGFAAVAAVALFVAIQVGSKDDSTIAAASPSSSTAAVPAPKSSPPANAILPGVELVEAEQTETAPAENAQSEEPQRSSELQAVDVVRSCVPTAMLRGGVSLGMSLLFTEDGTVKRSFTGRLPFSRAQIQCLKEGLGAIKTSSEREMGRMMSYDLYVSVTAERTRAREARP